MALPSLRLPRYFFYCGVLLMTQTSWRPFFSVTLSDWFFLAAVLSIFPLFILHGKKEVPFPRLFLIGLGLILVGGFLATPGAQWPLSSFFSLTKIFYLVGIWFLAGTVLLQKPEDVQKAMVLWVISVGVTSFAAAVQLIWGVNIPGTSADWGRMTGYAEHANDLGGATSVALVPALYLAAHAFESRWSSLGIWIIACLILSGLVWSASLTAALAVVTGLLVWILLNKAGLRHVLVLMIGSGAIVYLVSVFSPETNFNPITEIGKVERLKAQGEKRKKLKPDEPPTERPMTQSREAEENQAIEAFEEMKKSYRVKRGDPPMLVARMIQLKEKAQNFKTLQLRIENFQLAWKSISQNVFIGVGLGPQNGITEIGRLVHNLWLSYWYEGGVLALIGIIFLVGAIAKSGIAVLHSSDFHVRQIGMAIFSAFSAFLVLTLAQPIFYKRFEWFPALLIITLYSNGKHKQ